MYKIANKINGKVYYGSASVSFKERWSGHREQLKSNRHPNSHLQSAYNIYGIDAFEYSIVLICHPDECLMYEQMCLDLYWDKGKDCYNIYPTAGSPRGYEKPKAHTEKIANIQRGQKKQTNTSGYAGVHKNKQGWVSRIQVREKRINLGVYATPEEAHNTYQKALELVRAGKEVKPELRLKSNNKSGFVGVIWHKASQKWIADIGYDGKKYFLGVFDTAQEASLSYQQALLDIKSGKEPAKKLRITNKSGFRGVCWNKKTKKWQAQFKHKHLGYFDTPEEASNAYQSKLAELKKNS